MGNEPTKYMEHISFDNKEVLIWLAEFPLPTMPTPSQFDESTPEGQIKYIQAFEDWQEAIESINVDFPWKCPYTFKSNKLYIGNLYNGDVDFTNSDSFTPRL